MRPVSYECSKAKDIALPHDYEALRCIAIRTLPCKTAWSILSLLPGKITVYLWLDCSFIQKNGQVLYVIFALIWLAVNRALLDSLTEPDSGLALGAVTFLASSQNADGGWGFYRDDTSSLYITSIVMRTLARLT